MEVGSFNGAQPTDVTVSTNECDMTGAGSGGYSFGAVLGGSVTNNTFNAGAQTTGIAAIEYAPSLVNTGSGAQTSCTGGTVSGNTIIGGNISLERSVKRRNRDNQYAGQSAMVYQLCLLADRLAFQPITTTLRTIRLYALLPAIQARVVTWHHLAAGEQRC